MSRFFFNVTDRYNSPDEEEAVELPNVAAARERAVQGARALLCDDIMRGILDLNGFISVIDEAGKVLTVVRFDEVVVRSLR